MLYNKSFQNAHVRFDKLKMTFSWDTVCFLLYSPCFARLSGSLSPLVPAWTSQYHPVCPVAVTFEVIKSSNKITLTQCPTETENSRYVTVRVWELTNSPLGKLLSRYETVRPPHCWSLFQLYHNTVKSSPSITKELLAWLTDFDHRRATDLARLPATQCSSWLHFAAEALVLLCVRKNNMERCCRLKWLWLSAIVDDAILLTLAHSLQITRLGLRR